MKKILFLILGMLAIAGLIYYLQLSSLNNLKLKDTETPSIKTYSIKNKKVESHATLPHEMVKAQIKDTLPEKKLIRKISPNKTKVDFNKVIFTNKIATNWREQLSKNLMKFQKETTKVIVETKESLILVRNGKGTYAEKVSVSYFDENDGYLNGFTALVDSETGNILKTWDRTTWLMKKSDTIEYKGDL